jgi:hypothetical protein
VIAFRPVILLVNEPVPVPFTVLVVNDIVGLVVVLQQIPLDVMVTPPSDVMFPPDVGVEVVRFVGVIVVRIGMVGIIVVSLRQRTENPTLLGLLNLFKTLFK